MRPRIPNLFIAGASKCGTTSLFRLLSADERIFGSHIKEPEFFYHPVQQDGLFEYAKLFEFARDSRYAIDASAEYLFGGPEVVERVRKYSPEARIVLLFRNPEARFVSYYRHLKHIQLIGHDVTIRDFYAACVERSKRSFAAEDFPLGAPSKGYSALVTGRYVDYLAPWIDQFDRNVFVGFFESMIMSPESFLRSVYHFLDLSFPSEMPSLERENQTLNHKSPIIQSAALRVYGKFGETFNRNISLKRKLLSAYRVVNTSRDFDSLEPDLEEELASYYANSTAKLREYLSGLGYSGFPNWLDPNATETL